MAKTQRGNPSKQGDYCPERGRIAGGDQENSDKDKWVRDVVG
jgi:hypothetical protein